MRKIALILMLISVVGMATGCGTKENVSAETVEDAKTISEEVIKVQAKNLTEEMETESETTEEVPGIEMFNGRFLKDQQILVIEVHSNQTADILLMDQRNSGVNTIIDDTATFENGELLVDLTIDWNGTPKTEVVTIQSVDEATVNLVMSEAFQERLNAPLAGNYERDENSAGTIENAFSEEEELNKYLGNYSLNGAIDLSLYLEDGVLSAESGDDVVMGKSIHTYTNWSLESGNYLICDWEHGCDSFHLNDDGSLTLATGGSFPELEGTYTRK